MLADGRRRRDGGARSRGVLGGSRQTEAQHGGRRPRKLRAASGRGCGSGWARPRRAPSGLARRPVNGRRSESGRRASSAGWRGRARGERSGAVRPGGQPSRGEWSSHTGAAQTGSRCRCRSSWAATPTCPRNQPASTPPHPAGGARAVGSRSTRRRRCRCPGRLTPRTGSARRRGSRVRAGSRLCLRDGAGSQPRPEEGHSPPAFAKFRPWWGGSGGAMVLAAAGGTRPLL